MDAKRPHIFNKNQRQPDCPLWNIQIDRQKRLFGQHKDDTYIRYSKMVGTLAHIPPSVAGMWAIHVIDEVLSCSTNNFQISFVPPR